MAEFMVCVKLVKLVMDEVKQIVKNNIELGKKAKSLQRDMLLIDLVVNEVESSGVVFSPQLQLAMGNLCDKMNEVKEAMLAIESKNKWYHKVFKHKSRLESVVEAGTKISDQINMLPAAFEFTQMSDMLAGSTSLSEAIQHFLKDPSVRSYWSELNVCFPGGLN
jgi:hypothetical protein